MDYAEFWALEIAATGGVPFSCVVGPRSGIEAQWCKAYHNLGKPEMIGLLDQLARNQEKGSGLFF